ncbi:hypothetical protein SAMN05444411_101395 [Lutibacter oricola]|uniref:VanZ like family protein n=1 Tax=Lutibacter oricola TaxID=762486 RepID=A0A1H2S5P3_9FLAO|nr:VanZ family protein [Lutibacter oricola]SDW26987.1 hypothetical protein SAMN05444411_101395 [Lutibacter oricola]
MRKLFLITAILITAAITVGSLISIQSSIKINVTNSDKLVHFGAYAILTLNWLLVIKNHSNLRKKVVFVAFSVLIYGIVIEALQGALTAYRQADYLDILANSVGIITAVLVFMKVFVKYQRN